MAYRSLKDGAAKKLADDFADSSNPEMEGLVLPTAPGRAIINDRSRYVLQEEQDEENVDLHFREQEEKCFKVFRYFMVILTFLFLIVFLLVAVVLIALSPSCKPADQLVWWKASIIYQCYPRSFKDSSGDGKGDLRGIISKVDYLHNLGIGTVWLNPIFKSPQNDNGYDVSNYKEIDSLYGSIEDFKELLAALHSKGMHLILDFVPNHTSDEHEWFVESRSSKTDSKRDWYVWKDPAEDGGPPNNWLSLFGGSAWTYDNNTQQYYYHVFAESQPDLNFRNPEVIRAIEDAMKFWLDLGVDGFRMDAVKFLLEDAKLRDEPKDQNFVDKYNCSTTRNANRLCYYTILHPHTQEVKGVHDIVKGFKRVMDSYKDSPRFLIGETYDSVSVVVKYYGHNGNEMSFPFNFILLSIQEWSGVQVSQKVAEWIDALPRGAWPNWVLGNHDQGRIASRAGTHLARALNMLLLTLPGTPTTYYGEEIFMTDVYVPPDRRNDIYQDRDKERTPMQWDTSANAGFTNATTPWLPVADNYTTYNVAVESSDPSSMLSLYKRLAKLIAVENAFRYAEYEEVMSSEELFAYRRFHKGTNIEYVVMINFSKATVIAHLKSIKDRFLNPVVELSSAGRDRDGEIVDLTSIKMAPGEGLIIKGDSFH